MSSHFHVRLRSELLSRVDRTPLQKLVLAYLAFRTGHIGRTWRGQPTMAAELGIAERSVRRVITELVALGDVEIVVRGRGRTKTNSYALKQDKMSGFSVPENRTSCPKKPDKMSSKKKQRKRTVVVGDHNARISSPCPDAQRPKETFVAPTPTEVHQYAESIGYNLDAERFVDYYASKGWRLGRSRMRDWRAVVRNWQRRAAERAGTEPEDANDPTEEEAARLLGFGPDQGGAA